MEEETNADNSNDSTADENQTIQSKIMFLLKKIFIRHSAYLVLFLWIYVLALSSIKEFVSIPKGYFDNKNNFFNVVFVKWGWGWTLVTTGSYMVVTSFVYGVDSWKKSVLRSITRLIIATCFWYFWVNIVFHTVENLTGICVGTNDRPNFDIITKDDCKKLRNGSVWNGFDISGHCFLLTYSILLINSEIQIHRCWHGIENVAFKIFSIGSTSLIVFKQRLRSTYVLVNVLFILNCLLLSIWFLMLAATSLYFHTFYSKALGTSCAIISWMVTYNEWYKCRLSPGMPGSASLQRFLQKSKTE